MTIPTTIIPHAKPFAVEFVAKYFEATALYSVTSTVESVEEVHRTARLLYFATNSPVIARVSDTEVYSYSHAGFARDL